MSDTKKCLLICPSFFGYDIEIKNALERNGYLVTLYDERPFSGVIGKSLIRLGLSFLTKLFIKNYYNKVFDTTDDHYDLLLIINPESITPDILIRFKDKCDKVIVYMWDSFKNKKKSHELINYADVFFTFEPRDADAYNIKYKSLFYVPEFICEPAHGSVLFDVSFVGTAHSLRFKVVNEIARGHNQLIFFYCPSKIVFFIKKFFLKELSGMKIDDVSFIPLNRKTVVDILKSSKAVIDIAHPKQNGLTMRTIESIGSQRKLITTNKNVKNYDFYNESNVLVIENEINSKVISDFLALNYITLPADVREKYYIDNWIRDIIKEEPVYD